jgi:hypothetical protein
MSEVEWAIIRIILRLSVALYGLGLCMLYLCIKSRFDRLEKMMKERFTAENIEINCNNLTIKKADKDPCTPD